MNLEAEISLFLSDTTFLGSRGNRRSDTHHLGGGGDDWAREEDNFGNLEGGAHHLGKGGETAGQRGEATLATSRAAHTTVILEGQGNKNPLLQLMLGKKSRK